MDIYTDLEAAKILEIGACDVNGSLRQHALPTTDYVGIDLEDGPGVDIVIEPGALLPVEDDSFDLVVASSVLEHDPAFWMTFLEMCRKAKKGGYIYVNVPSNGAVHRYPEDHWRFYPDSGIALVRWAKSQNQNIRLIESFVADRTDDIWNDFVAVFRKEPTRKALPAKLLYEQTPSSNVHSCRSPEVINPRSETEDMVLMSQARSEAAQAGAEVARLQGSLATQAEELAQIVYLRHRLETELGEASDGLAKALAERDAITTELADERDRLANVADERDNIVAELADAGVRFATVTDERDRAAAELTKAGDRLASVAIERDGFVAELADAGDRLASVTDERDRVAAELNDAHHRLNNLESTLRQRAEEIAQAAAQLERKVAEFEAEIAVLTEHQGVLTKKLEEAEAWVFRLAGDRQTAERDTAQARQELDAMARHYRALAADAERLQSMAALRDQALAALKAEQAAEREAAVARLNADQTAERERNEQLKTEHEAALERSKTEARRHAELHASAEMARLAIAGQLADRFTETALLSRVVLEKDRAYASEVDKSEWLRQISVTLATQPRWWSLLPTTWRRKREHRRLQRRELFDAQAYLERYPDVGAAGFDPLRHYILHGIFENREI